jgi:radical SAM superfamily enzyme YgiQ (UPF0313 family)
MPLEKKRKLLLINPICADNMGISVNQGQRYPPLGLGMVAALTPESWDIEILDEVFDPYDYSTNFREADLVGLTAFTFTVNRAYEIAGVYRKKGIKTIIGGIHASMLPDEAIQFVDSVVIGEAEGVWTQVILDFEEGKLKPRYEGGLCELKGQPKPRHDLFHPGYWFASIQTTRGCPMNCSFCSVTSFNGNHYRMRPVDEVLDEIATVQHKNMIFFVDDNIIGYGKESRQHALSIFRGMVERGITKQWFSQASINFADSDEVMQAASESGCRLILLGIEAEKAEQLKEANKMLNAGKVDSYGTIFRRIHRHNISILGTFIFGLDSDTVNSMRDRVKYILNSGVDSYMTTILTPLPGTVLFNRLEKEGRLLKTEYPEGWSNYQFTNVVFNPTNISPEELMDEMMINWGKLYNLRTIRWKTFRTFLNQRNWNFSKWFKTGVEATAWAYYTNWHYHQYMKIKAKNKKY